MLTTEDRAVAVGHSVDPARWQGVWDEVMARIAGRFTRVEPRRTARAFLAGLLSGVERKNCWWLAEHAGHRGPQRMQRLLRKAVWDADQVRDDVRDLVVETLGRPDGVLIADETGFLKKGVHCVAVQRQYTGTAGRIENSQVAVFLAYASSVGRALIDRRIYLPASWSRDQARCAAAGVPEQESFATKPRLALDMVTRSVAAGVPARWVTADEVYGNDPAFRAGVQALGLGYVLAVACDHRVPVNGGTTRMRADRVAGGLPRAAWQRYSAGVGSKGPRWYDWAWIDVATDTEPGQALLIRRNNNTGELAFYRCWTPAPVSLAILVRVAGTRWCVEESFQAAKGQVGLDQYQVRGWTPWHRFITLAMLALAVLSILAATARQHDPEPHHYARSNDPIALTTQEIRHLIDTLLIKSCRNPVHLLYWSIWRRCHQATARRAHYRHRLATEFRT